MSARLFQRYTGSSGGDQVRVTGAGLGLVHEINQVSRFGLDFTAGFQQAAEGDTGDGDITRLGAAATYSYDITEVVSAEVGYRSPTARKTPDESTPPATRSSSRSPAPSKPAPEAGALHG